MALDGGLTVLVCSIFFVFLALLKQNVLIFVSHNLDHRPLISPSQKKLFQSFDVDSNGIIDQDEFLFIAKTFDIEDGSEFKEPELDEIYTNISFKFAGSSDLPASDKEVVFNTKTFSVFQPPSLSLGHNWHIYKGLKTSPLKHFSSPIRPNYAHYPLYQIVSLIHWNVVFNTPSQTPISSAIVTGISDTHVRISFNINVEFQLNTPPSPPLWYTPCQTCGTRCHLVGVAVYTLPELVLDYFEITCGSRASCNENEVLFRSVGGPYEYKIQKTRLVAVPLSSENVDYGVSYAWQEEIVEKSEF